MSLTRTSRNVILNLPERNATPGTDVGTARAMTVAVARAISSGLYLSLSTHFRPGKGNEGLIIDPVEDKSRYFLASATALTFQEYVVCL